MAASKTKASSMILFHHADATILFRQIQKISLKLKKSLTNYLLFRGSLLPFGLVFRVGHDV
jgi:hypothetical protein